MPPSGPKVLIVEDEHDLLAMYKLKLDREGFQVATAIDGQAGLKLAETFQPDLMLVDLLLPGMSGTEMLQELRSRDWGSDVRVVVITNISKDEAPQALRFLHIDRYIVKALYTPSQVVSIVRDVLGHPKSKG
ncbi:MAG TPA: response regulator [Candidatus Saccharimonadales bacterium]|nr:response regulator [Candidatus Saccharimonadales bacterium]